MKDWKKVYSVSKRVKAELIKGMLSQHGIESMELSSKDSSFLIGSIDIYVKPQDEEKAKQLIKNHQD